MKKESFDRRLADDEFLNEGPIEAHLRALGSEGRTPVVSLAACLTRIEEASPPLRDLLARAADGVTLAPEEETLLFRGVHILGAARIEQAWPDLLRLLRRPDEELEPLLGDAVTETLPRIAAGMFNGDAGSLFEAIGERGRDEYVRDALWDAATFLTWEGRIDRELTRERLVWFFEDRRAADGDHSWIGWQGAIAHLGLRDLTPLVERAFAQHRMPYRVMEFRHFAEDLAAAERAPNDPERLKAARMGYIEDVLAALDWSDHDDEAPAANPFRHVGRNDPCPCGSGTKAKKCCLAA